MSDFDALELQETEIPNADAVTTSFLAQVRAFVGGALFTAAVAAVGTVLFTVALMIAVVGSPIIVVAVAWAVLRRQRADRVRAWTAPHPATG